jgi:hypothetical protein
MHMNRFTGLASALAVVGGGLVFTAAAPVAHATGLEPTSWGAANMISAADSDFEGSLGTWVSYSNTTVSDDSSQAFLHRGSMKLTATTSGTQAAKMGGTGALQVNVTGGDTYRESAWVKVPAAGGRTITFADGFYNAGGTWLGWTSGTTVTLNSTGKWQYVSSLITAPATAGYMLGSPRITETGVAAGEVMNVDEVMVEPYRAATLIGAKDPSTNASQFASANSTIGPLQADKMFYDPSQALPASYSASTCASLPVNVTCVLSYKVQNTNVASFVGSIPPGRNTIIVWWQEAERFAFTGPGSNGQNFVADFEAQANLIRASVTAANISNVFVAMDSSTYQYQAGSSHNLGGAGAGCTFIPPAQYVDFYLGDHYEPTASGGNMPSVAGPASASPGAEWTGWLGCVAPQNKPIGIAEYGLNGDNSPNYGNDPTTAQAFAADNTYLESQPDGLPVMLWAYWWYNNDANWQFTPGGSPNGTQAVTQWQANEHQNGGGAN